MVSSPNGQFDIGIYETIAGKRVLVPHLIHAFIGLQACLFQIGTQFGHSRFLDSRKPCAFFCAAMSIIDPSQ